MGYSYTSTWRKDGRSCTGGLVDVSKFIKCLFGGSCTGIQILLISNWTSLRGISDMAVTLGLVLNEQEKINRRKSVTHWLNFQGRHKIIG